MSATTTTTASSGFTDQLATSGQIGDVSFVTTPATSCGLDASSSGATSTTGTLPAGSCTVSGTDSDAFGDTGTWTYTLTIAAVAITQAAPMTGTTTTSLSSTFTDQLATTGQTGAVSFVTSSDCGVVVSSSGAVTTSGTLSVGACTTSGTDSDTAGDSGSWTYTLTVTPAAIIQEAPTNGTTTTTASAAFTDQLVTSGQIGEVTFDATSTPCGLEVAFGAITTTGTLPKGSCTMSGVDYDNSGNTGTWTFTLMVTPVASTTTLSVTPSSASYGGEGRESFTVTLTGTGGVLPTGAVTIRDGTTTLCSTTTLTPETGDAVSATCRLGDLELSPGSYSATAFYGGDDHYDASVSKPASFAVTKDPVTITVSESPTTVIVGHESQAVFAMSIATANGEAVLNGTTLIVYLGSTACTVTIESGTGTCTIPDSALPAGTYTVTASFSGDVDLEASTLTSSTLLTVSSGTTVPIAPTGQPWSSQLYLWLIGGMGIAGLALIESARRRFVSDRRRGFRPGS